MRRSFSYHHDADGYVSACQRDASARLVRFQKRQALLRAAVHAILATGIGICCAAAILMMLER